MPIYEFSSQKISPVNKTDFADVQMYETDDLQRLLKADISVIDPDLLVIAEEFNEWDGSLRRIDLLAVDKNANLVVIELKRTKDGGHMDLQAIRYAAMVSTMTFDQAADVYGRYLEKNEEGNKDGRTELLKFLERDEPFEDAFAQDVRILLVSANFGLEVTTSVLWLTERGIDIRCVRLQPYNFEGRVLVDIQQIIPLPEVAEYQIRVAEKKRKEREARTDTRDWTSYDVTLGGHQLNGQRKRHAIYHVFRYLVESGIAPEKVATHCGPRANRALVSVNGEVNAEDFFNLAKEAREKEGRSFDPTRYFCAEKELIRYNGRTYAFLNQWGGLDWEQAMTDLCDTFADHGIEFKASE